MLFTKQDIEKSIKNLEDTLKLRKELALESLEQKDREFNEEKYKQTLVRIYDLKKMLEEMN